MNVEAQGGKSLQTEAVTIADVLKVLIKAMPGKIIGWEKIQTISDVIDEKAILSAIKERDLEKTAKVINENTGYKCLVDSGCFIVVPKEAELPPGGTMTKRLVSYPSAKEINSNEYVYKIAPTDEETAKFTFGGVPFSSANVATGIISMDAGSDVLSKVLNKIAYRIKARCWIVSDSVNYDSKTHKAILPALLNYGNVEFYSTANRVPYDDALSHVKW